MDTRPVEALIVMNEEALCIWLLPSDMPGGKAGNTGLLF